MAFVTWVLPIYMVILIIIIAFGVGRLYQDTSNSPKFIRSNSIHPIAEYCNNYRFKSNTGGIILISLLIVLVAWVCLLSAVMVFLDGANAKSMESHITISDSDTLSEYPDHRSFGIPKRINSNHLINADNRRNSDREPDQIGRGDYPWSHIYKARVWCSVLTMWPERRQNIEAVIGTWGSLCDRIIFAVDNSSTAPTTTTTPPQAKSYFNDNIRLKLDAIQKRKERDKAKFNKTDHEWEEAPDSYLGFDFLKLEMDGSQSEHYRNIWEKSWRTWHYVGSHHLEEAEWFLKLDDDTFFSPINFKGFARYFNPDKEWYLGNTMLHQWKTNNIVFNAGACYAISRGALRKLATVFERKSFFHREREVSRLWYCMHRRGQFEDPSMGICLRSIGINPTNTLDRKYRQRFSPFTHRFHESFSRLKRPTEWYWRWKPVQSIDNNDGKDCCAEHMISFHGYKHAQVDELEALHQKYNIEEGVNGKRFDIPQTPKLFLHQELDFEIDDWRNSLESFAIGQFVYQGPDKEHLCWNCNKTKVG